MRKLLGVTAVATIAIAVAACSGKKSSSGGTNSVTGTIGGLTFTPKSGSFDVLPENGTNVANVGILSDDPDFCANATATTASLLANSKLMAFLFGHATNSTSFGVATNTGAYTVINIGGTVSSFPPDFFGGEFAAFDNTCNSPTFSILTTAGSPSVDITKLTSAAIDGKGTGLKWDTGDTTDVSFAFKSCPGLAALFGGPSLCKH